MTDSKPPAPRPDHLGTVIKILTTIGFLVGGAFGLIKIGIWIGQVQAPPVAVQVPAEFTAEIGACREMARLLRVSPILKDVPK